MFTNGEGSAWSIDAWSIGIVAVVLIFALIGLSTVLLTFWRRDATSRRHIDAAEAQLRTSQTQTRERDLQLSAIIGSVMDAIVTTDVNQMIILFNAAAERTFGIAAAQAIGQPLSMLLPERFRSVHEGHVERFATTGVTTRRMGARQSLVGLRVGGSDAGHEFPIEASISQTTEAGERLFTVILRDISERVQSEAEIEYANRELRRMAKAANEALEVERRRVARELHDELGQQLTALKMGVGDARNLVRIDQELLAHRLDQMRDVIDQTVASTRRISSDLRPLILDDLGLEAALEWLVRGFQQRTGIVAMLAVAPELAQIGEPHASAIFRIAQESLTNVARHAQAREVSIQVKLNDTNVQVEVRDDGCGIQPGDAQKPDSHGLLGIRERTRLLGGSATIDNHASGGAVVTARLPLAPIADMEGARL